MFNTTLRSVDLRGNELGDAGAAQICRALKEHSNEGLFELDLGYNEIKDDGACFLAQVITPCANRLPGQLCQRPHKSFRMLSVSAIISSNAPCSA